MDKQAFEILSFYNELIFHNGIEQLKVDFENWGKYKDQGYTFKKEINLPIQGVFKPANWCPPSDSDYSVHFDVELFDYLKHRLKKENSSLLKKAETIQFKLSPETFKELLNNAYLLAEKYLKKINKSNDNIIPKNQLEIVSSNLNNVIADLKMKFSNEILIQETSKTNQKTIYSFFDPVIEKAFFFKDLYKVTYELSIIDDVEVSVESFQNVFTEPKPTDNIQFTCNGSIISYYFESIQCFFKQLSPKKIEESNAFLSKQGKVITKQNLYTSKERGKHKYLDFKERIDEQVEILKSTYIK